MRSVFFVSQYSVARSTDISVLYGYIVLFLEYGRISNVYSILQIFTVPLLRARHLSSVNYLGASFSIVDERNAHAQSRKSSNI